MQGAWALVYKYVGSPIDWNFGWPFRLCNQRGKILRPVLRQGAAHVGRYLRREHRGTRHTRTQPVVQTRTLDASCVHIHIFTIFLPVKQFMGRKCPPYPYLMDI